MEIFISAKILENRVNKTKQSLTMKTSYIGKEAQPEFFIYENNYTEQQPNIDSKRVIWDL